MAAHAPVPQASVSAAPRSHTRKLTLSVRQDLDELGVDVLWERRVGFYLWADGRHRIGLRVVYKRHGVRVSH